MKPQVLPQSVLMAKAEARDYSSGSVLSLENRVLAQASVLSQHRATSPTLTSFSSCPALHPSHLSSPQLKQDSSLFPSLSSLYSSHSPSSALQRTAASAGSGSAGAGYVGQPSSGGLSAGGGSATECVDEGRLAGGGSAGQHSDEGRSTRGSSTLDGFTGGLSGRGRSAGLDQENLSVSSEELTEDFGLVETDEAPPQSELPVLEPRVAEEKMIELGEEYEDLESTRYEEAEMLKEKKYKLLNMVCCSLVNKSCSPGQKDWKKKSVWIKIWSLAMDITLTDPEFLLKVAVYTRHKLNKRLLSSFLLSLAAHLPDSKPHVRRYFCAVVQEPSDWLQVPRIYSECFSSSLPTCLKKGLVDKFKQFSENQLVKYSTNKRRKRKPKDHSPEQCEKWAKLLRSDTSTLQKHLQKNQSEFTMEKLIKRLHIKEPAELVMSILGKKYPADVEAFKVSGLSGVWDSERAGQKLKLNKLPDTWQTTLSREGNKAETWEKLIDSDSLPFMVMLKNLRNLITLGISTKHHDTVLQRLTSESAVIQSKLLPFSFLSAYKVIMQLQRFVDDEVKPDSGKVALQGVLNRFKRNKRYQDTPWASVGQRRVRAVLKAPFIYRLYNVKRRILKRSRQRRFTGELLERYLQALLTAVQLSYKYNLPLLPGHTLIFLPKYFYYNEWKWMEQLFIPPDPLDANEDLPEPSENIQEPSENLPETSENLPETSGNHPEPSENLSETSEKEKENSHNVSTQKAGMLLAVMLKRVCEHSQLLFMSYRELQEAQITSENFLENYRQGMKRIKEFGESDDSKNTSFCNFFSKLTEEKTKVDNIIVLSEYSLESDLLSELQKYRKNSSADVLVVNVLLHPDKCLTEEHEPHSVNLNDFSKQILKVLSERGSLRILDHVENIDKLLNVRPPAAEPKRNRDKTERTTYNPTVPTTPHPSELVSCLPWAPSSMAVSPGGRFVAVGTEHGSLHVFLSDTKQEVKSVVSSCDGVSGCVFIEEGVICITSHSGQMEVWNIHSGCRMACLDAHSSRITGCDVSSDRKQIATVSLDHTLKVWLSQGLQQVASFLQPSPPNCVTFHLTGILLAVGCWDGAVRVWDWKRQKNPMILSGHHSAVRSVSFCPSSPSLLCSASFDGEVRLWSVPEVTCVWRDKAHCSSVEALCFLPDGETLLSAGRDGMIQVWSAGFGCVASVHAEQKVQNGGFLYCDSGAIRALASGRDGCFFSVSDDRTLRSWSIMTDRRPRVTECLSAVCFMERGEVLVCCFSSGRLELRHHNRVIYSEKVSESHIQAVAAMPDEQLAIGCDRSVTVWKMELNLQSGTASLCKVSSYTLENPVSHLLYSNVLVGVCYDYSIIDVYSTTKLCRSVCHLSHNTRPLGLVHNDARSVWVLGENHSKLQLIFLLTVDCGCWHSYCNVKLSGEKDSDDDDDDDDVKEDDESEASDEKHSKKPCEEPSEGQSEESYMEQTEGCPEEQSEEPQDLLQKTHEEPFKEQCKEPSVKYKERKVWITTAAIHKGFIVCGDYRGNMWTNQPPNMATWSEKRRVHSDRVSVLRLTDKTIISASHDGTVKLWDRNTYKQVGQFVCGAPVEILEVNEDVPGQLVCGDTLGQVHVLCWAQ